MTKNDLIRSILKKNSCFCDRILKGYSVKVTSDISSEQKLLLSMLADKVVKTTSGCTRYHFYGYVL